MLRIITLVGFGAIFWLYRRRNPSRAQHHARDAVCGTQVQKEHAPATTTASGQQYWFCSDHCLHRFNDDPGRFIKPADAASYPHVFAQAAQVVEDEVEDGNEIDESQT